MGAADGLSSPRDSMGELSGLPRGGGGSARPSFGFAERGEGVALPTVDFWRGGVRTMQSNPKGGMSRENTGERGSMSIACDWFNERGGEEASEVERRARFCLFDARARAPAAAAARLSLTRFGAADLFFPLTRENKRPVTPARMDGVCVCFYKIPCARALYNLCDSAIVSAE